MSEIWAGSSVAKITVVISLNQDEVVVDRTFKVSFTILICLTLGNKHNLHASQEGYMGRNTTKGKKHKQTDFLLGNAKAAG